MLPSQQRLFPDSQPLVERLGRDFFRRLPEVPGVYLMHGACSVLYVGKAKSLRHRLCSYRVANPENMAKRTLRLLPLVQKIEWEECPDELSALRRESELLLELKPRFNRAGVWKGPDRYLAWREAFEGVEIAVMDSPKDGWCCMGPRGSSMIHLHRALVRLLWCRLRHERGLYGMPAGWIGGKHGLVVLVPESCAEARREALHSLQTLVSGDAEGFEKWLIPASTIAAQALQEEDLELATKLFSPMPLVGAL